MNSTEIFSEGWGTYGTLIVAILTLLVNLHQSYRSKFFGMQCYNCCEMVYDIDYKDQTRNVNNNP